LTDPAEQRGWRQDRPLIWICGGCSAWCARYRRQCCATPMLAEFADL